MPRRSATTFDLSKQDRARSVKRAPVAIPHLSSTRIVGTALRETYQRFVKDLSSGLSSEGLTISMWFVLRALWDEDGINQTKLAERLDLSPAAIVKIVNQLHAMGLLVRRQGSDRRASYVFLTRKGRAIRRAATATALQTDARALRGFSAAEAATLLDMLSRLRENLSAASADKRL